MTENGDKSEELFPEELMPPKEVFEQADKDVTVVVLTRGRFQNGEPFYAYLAIPPSKVMDFAKAEKQGNYNLEDYGTIIKLGNTYDPPDEVKKAMEVIYDVDHNFEKKVAREFMKAAKKKILDDRFGPKKKMPKKDNPENTSDTADE